MPRTISLQVPPDAEAGDSLTFVVEGKELEIPIPHGSQSGDVLEIQVDASADDVSDQDRNNTNGECQEDNNEDVDLQFNLPNGKRLLFSTEEDSTKNKANSGVVGLGGGVDVDDGTYAHPWPCGLTAMKFWSTDAAKQLMTDILSRVESDKTKANNDGDDNSFLKVLELGSGLGLVGLSFAAQYSEVAADSSLPSLGKTILSDVGEGMTLLQHNLARNASSLPQDTVVKAIPLLWTKEDPTRNDNMRNEKFDLILASDVLYNTESIPVLVATVKRFLSANTSTSLILAVRWRKPDLERPFFEALEGWHDKHWHLIHTPSSCPLSWKEFGNPKCETSNLYFHTMMVSVWGKPTSLAMILKDESRQEEMTDQEAEAFENCHIQIYCLTSKKVTVCARSEGSNTIDIPSTTRSENRKRPREGD